MALVLPHKCPRQRDDCRALCNILDNEEGFVCAGINDGSTSRLKQDQYRFCFKGPYIDELSDYDHRDIMTQIHVLAGALVAIDNGA